MAFVWSDAIDGIDRDELAALYLVAPLARKKPADLHQAFANGRFPRFAFEDGKLVAAGGGAGRRRRRGLCDIALLPSHQGAGLVRQIVADLLNLARGHRKIFLYSVPGKEGFDARLGFRRMTTAMALFDDQAAAIARGYLAAD